MATKLKSKGVEMRKNSTTGLVEYRDPNLDLAWKPAKFIGHNFNGGDQWHQFGSPYANITAFDAPDTFDFFLSLIGNKPNTNIVSPTQAINGNSFRVYAPAQGSCLSIIEDEASNNAEANIVGSSDGVLFIPNLYNENIQCSGIPTITINNAPLNTSYAYYPLIIDESKGRISNKGRLVGLMTKQPLSGLSSGQFNAITVTITNNVASVGGNSSVNSFTVGDSSSLKILRGRALTTVAITEAGSGYNSTNFNKGFGYFNFNLQNWYQSPTSTSDSRVAPIVIGRIGQYDNLVVTGSNTKPDYTGDYTNTVFDYYFNENKINFNQDKAGIMDVWILDGGENMPNEASEAFSFSLTADSNNWFDRIYKNQWYIYDYEGFNTSTRKTASMAVKDTSFEQLRQAFIAAKKRGVFLSINIWDGRHPYNSGGFSKSKEEKSRLLGYYLAEWETQMNKVITYVDSLCIEFNTCAKILMANESTLDYTMGGVDYSNDTDPNPTYGDFIYWWDPANPTNRMANLRKQLGYYNAIVKRYKNNASRSQRLLFSYVGQYGNNEQAQEIEDLILEGRLSSFDFFSNNYYGNYSVLEPQRNGSGQNILDRYVAFFNAQADISKKIPMLLSECGIPAKIFLVPKTLNVGTSSIPIAYNNTNASFILNGVDVTNQIIVIDNIAARGELIKNLIIWAKNKPAIIGVQHFGLTLQNGRSLNLQYMEWDSFNCPFPVNVPGGVTSSTHDVFFDEYWMGDLNYPVVDKNEYTSLHDMPSTQGETTSIYNSSLTKMKEALSTYNGNDALIHNI